MKLNPLIILGMLTLVFTSPAALAEKGHDHHKKMRHEAHARHMLEGYAAVSRALYKDDLAAAKKNAAGMVKHDKDSKTAKPAQAIANSETLEEARRHFKQLSDIAIPIAKREKTMHVAYCPMAMKGKGAAWLQKSDGEIRNPYMGAKMPHCGTIKD